MARGKTWISLGEVRFVRRELSWSSQRHNSHSRKYTETRSRQGLHLKIKHSQFFITSVGAVSLKSTCSDSIINSYLSKILISVQIIINDSRLYWMHDITLAFGTICGKSGSAYAVERRGRGNFDGNVICIWTGHAHGGGISGSVSGGVRPVRASYRKQQRKFISENCE